MKRIRRSIIFNCRHGFLLRPASEAARIACSHGSEIGFSLVGNWADARSVFELLTLGVKHGGLVEVLAVGHDAEAAMNALGDFLDSCDEHGHSLATSGADFDSFAA